MLLIKGENIVTIDENNFDFLQNAIKDVFCLNNNNLMGA